MSETLASAELAAINEAERREVEDFLYKEARLADESRYSEWESLVDDDMFYWIPLGEGDYDRSRRVSITADNRNRLANRIKQLNTGARHSQIPPSPMRRMISNIELSRRNDSEYQVGYNFVLHEMRIQSTGHLEIWAGRIDLHLRRKQDGLRMFFKRVSLINSQSPLPSIGFIL